MAGDKGDRDPKDPERVDLEEASEVRHWTEKFGISEEQLQEVVRKVGPTADAVAQEIRGTGKLSDSR